MGTLRRRGTLDFALAPHLPRPIERAGPAARNALRLGAYQILFMRVPDRAAVYETVEAARRAGKEKTAGFVNAVLRALQRAGLPPAPRGDPVARLAASCSAPPELVRALVRSLGEGEAEAFLAASCEKPPFTVRANPFRTTLPALFGRLAEAGAGPAPCRFAPGGIVLQFPPPVFADPTFCGGGYLVMDEGAQLIAPLLLAAPGDLILDACAAPGGKTVDLAAHAGGKARIVAADVSPARVRLLRETIARTGAPGVEAVVHDLSRGPLAGARAGVRFDKILLDAPCTGTGVVRRNPDAKWRFRVDRARRMARLQGALLRAAFDLLRPGGLLVYCTCSVLREENEDVVEAFLGDTKEARLDPAPPAAWPGPSDAAGGGFVRLFPHRHGTDGFFAALVRKD